MQRAFSLLLLSTACALAACAADTPDVDEESAEADIQGGSTDTTHRYAVGLKIDGNALGSLRGTCSGTLIGENLVLTARHCVAPKASDEACTTFRGPVSASRITVTTDTRISARGPYGVAGIFVPEEASTCGADIALLVLDKAVPDVQPARPLLSRDGSSSITAIGFGATGSEWDGIGERRIRRNIATLPAGTGCTVAGRQQPCTVDAREFSTRGGICRGDSGSGAFLPSSVDAATPLVRGVAVRVRFAGDDCSLGQYTRTEAHAGLILGAARWAAQRGATLPDWAR